LIDNFSSTVATKSFGKLRVNDKGESQLSKVETRSFKFDLSLIIPARRFLDTSDYPIDLRHLILITTIINHPGATAVYNPLKISLNDRICRLPNPPSSIERQNFVKRM
jgi:hypothetical protein